MTKKIYVRKSEQASAPVIEYPEPAGQLISNWFDLCPGDLLEVQAASGFISYARVDMLSPDRTMLWLRTDGTGQRSLHLDTDDLMLFKQ